MTGSQPAKYQVIAHEADGDISRQIGVVEIGPRQRLKVLSVVPDRADFLHDLVERTNALDVLNVDAAAPAGARRRASSSKTIARNESGFRDALLERLHRELCLELISC